MSSELLLAVFEAAEQLEEAGVGGVTAAARKATYRHDYLVSKKKGALKTYRSYKRAKSRKNKE